MKQTIFVSILGLLITMLWVTGVIIWMKKRSARLLHSNRFASGTGFALQPAE